MVELGSHQLMQCKCMQYSAPPAQQRLNQAAGVNNCSIHTRKRWTHPIGALKTNFKAIGTRDEAHIEMVWSSTCLVGWGQYHQIDTISSALASKSHHFLDGPRIPPERPLQRQSTTSRRHVRHLHRSPYGQSNGVDFHCKSHVHIHGTFY